ncbi:putative ribonuclease H-like domain-containing protein [Tanacetum coccineum]
MRPFRCPVTILNTLDHLGKFDGKADEGFFVGYSITRNQPTWCFDIDTLTKSMNYELVVVGNQSNGNASTKACDDVGKASMKTDDDDPREDSEGVDEEKEDNVNSTNTINTASTNEVNVIDDNEDVGVETNMNNLDAFMPVSPILTTRVYKDHPVWTLVDLPKGKRAIGTKWVYKNKRDERVARIEAIRHFLAYASFKDFVVYQMDIKSAFLYGKIEEEVYVCQLLGFEDPHFPDRVDKVEKALYGLHQAWHETLSTYLLENGFQRGQIDKTLFIKRDKSDILLVQVYVDDIIFGSTRKKMCIEFEKMCGRAHIFTRSASEAEGRWDFHQ